MKFAFKLYVPLPLNLSRSQVSGAVVGFLKIISVSIPTYTDVKTGF